MRHSWELSGLVALAALLAWSASGLADRDLPRLAVVSAAFFVGSLIHIPFGPTAVHLLLNGIAGMMLGRRAPLAISCGLFLQVLLLHHGGWLTLGLNGVILSVPALLAGWLADAVRRTGRRSVRGWLAAIGMLCALLTVLLNALVLGVGGVADWSILVRLVILAHVPLMLIEGAIAATVVADRVADTERTPSGE